MINLARSSFVENTEKMILDSDKKAKEEKKRQAELEAKKIAEK